jgi:ubiquinone/menaquinone biosynthesis C-methylase UbiE
MMRRLRRALGRAIIIDRAPRRGSSTIDRIARERAEENYRFASRYVAGREVLDIGGGSGIGHPFLLAAGAARVVSIDIHGGLEGTAGRDPRLTYLQGDFVSYDFPDGSFDVLICIGVLFYLQQHDVAIGKMNRLLRPGGVLVINCIDRGLVARYFGMTLAEIDPKFTTTYTARELGDQLAQHFRVTPEAFVQQPVGDTTGPLAALRVWLAPLRWRFGRHPVSTAAARVTAMFNYFVVRKAT